MARKRASMREGPLAELFRATEAAQRGQTDDATTGTPEAPGREEAEAPVKGSSVLKYDPTGAAAEAYRELAREIVAAKEARDGAQARKHA